MMKRSSPSRTSSRALVWGVLRGKSCVSEAGSGRSRARLPRSSFVLRARSRRRARAREPFLHKRKAAVVPDSGRVAATERGPAARGAEPLWRCCSGGPAGRTDRPPFEESGAEMKFRGKIVDVACLNHFTRVVATISKLTKTCVLRLTPRHLYFVLAGKVANGGVGMWCELAQANFFDEYQMEGVSSEDNEICLEVAPDHLWRALRTLQNASVVKVKLTRKHCACLTVAAELPTPSGRGRVVTHDVPVDVIPRRLWREFKEPCVPDFDVSVFMPPLKTMKNVVDRMKNLSNFLVLEANRNGQMNLKIETDLVSVTTHFKDLGNPDWGGAASQQRAAGDMVRAQVDVRKLQLLLTGQQVNPSRALCGIVHQREVHVALLHDDVSLQYFIPAVA